MRLASAGCVVAAIVTLSGAARAEEHREARGDGAVHVVAMASYSTFVDAVGYLVGQYMSVPSAMSPLGPAGMVLWDRGRGRFVLGARLQAYPGSLGVGIEAAVTMGAVLVRRARFELLLLPAVGLAFFSGSTGIVSWCGTDTGPLFSLGLAGAVAAYHGLELFLFASFDVLPAHLLPFVEVGLDVVAGIGLGYRFTTRRPD